MAYYLNHYILIRFAVLGMKSLCETGLVSNQGVIGDQRHRHTTIAPVFYALHLNN